MGDHFSFCSKQQGRLTLVKMLRFVVLALMAAAALGAPGGGHYEYGYNQKHCHTKYNVKYDQQCHEEYDTIVDTTYTEQCQDIVTQHCNSVSQVPAEGGQTVPEGASPERQEGGQARVQADRHQGPL